MVADKGKMGFFFFFFLPPAPVFIHLEKKTLSISFSCYTSDYILVFGLPGGSRLPLSPQDVYGKGASGAGPRRAWTLGANPHRAPRLLPAQAKTPFGSAFVFPTPVTFAEVQPASGAPGVRAVAFPSTPKDDNRLGSRGEGEGGGRAGLGAETPTPALAPSPSSETPSQTAGVRAGGGLPARWGSQGGAPRRPAQRAPSQRARPRLTCSGRGGGAQLRGVRGAISPGRGAEAPDAGAAAVAPARTISGKSPIPRGLRRGGAQRRDAGWWGGREQRSERTGRRDLLSSSFSGPGLRRSLPAGPVSGLSAEDPPPGAALRLLRRRRRRRMRRQPLLPASRQPWLPPGPRGPSPAGRCAGSKREQTQGSIPSFSHTTPS